jgi:type II secretory pathway component PulJ
MTLTDLLVSVAVLGLLMAANLTLLDGGQRAWHHGSARIEAQENARVALTRMARDLRTAGAGAAATFPALSVAEPALLVFHRDENQDRTIAGTRETITWKLDGGVLRRDAGGGAQPVVNGVRELALRYFDANGAPTSEPRDVRSVEIVLATEPVTMSGTSVVSRMSTRVTLRTR